MNDIIPQDVPPPPPEVPVPPPEAPSTVVRKKKAQQRVILLSAAGVLAIAVLWYFAQHLSLPLRAVESLENAATGSIAGQPGQSFIAPSPITGAKGTPRKSNALTAQGIIAETNSQRAANGALPSLADNATLDAIAQLRLDDMFERQYFAHVGPQGESAITVASSVGYAHLSLGENLALGLYGGDAGVVAAWMGSPGHRENILDPHYTQIGVAARQGLFEGQQTWIAVQVFGRPASDCPMPDANLKTSIDLSEQQLSAMQSQLAANKATIDAMPSQSGPSYNAAVQDYNNLVSQYNNLAAQSKSAIALYDAQVTAFNQCLAK